MSIEAIGIIKTIIRVCVCVCQLWDLKGSCQALVLKINIILETLQHLKGNIFIVWVSSIDESEKRTVKNESRTFTISRKLILIWYSCNYWALVNNNKKKRKNFHLSTAACFPLLHVEIFWGLACVFSSMCQILYTCVKMSKAPDEVFSSCIVTAELWQLEKRH